MRKFTPVIGAPVLLRCSKGVYNGIIAQNAKMCKPEVAGRCRGGALHVCG